MVFWNSSQNPWIASHERVPSAQYIADLHSEFLIFHIWYYNTLTATGGVFFCLCGFSILRWSVVYQRVIFCMFTLTSTLNWRILQRAQKLILSQFPCLYYVFNIFQPQTNFFRHFTEQSFMSSLFWCHCIWQTTQKSVIF